MTRLRGVRGAALKGALLLVSTYLGLLLCETALRWQRPSMARFVTERGLYRADAELGVVLTPNYALPFDDGLARGEIRVNSLGHRDAEPAGSGANRVLLVGDSFTFGALLDQRDTINRWMEQLRPEMDVYNIGVSGYNLPSQLTALRRCTLKARLVLYLFFSNDLLPPDGETVVDGYRVARGKDGAPSDTQIRERLRELLSRPERRVWVSPGLPLTRALVRSSVARLIHGDVPADPVPEAEREQRVERSVEHTLQMRDEAERRGARFAVGIVPGLDEVRAGAYATSVARYVDALRAAGVPPIELRTALQTSDYWAHNLHFNREGARIAARVLVDAIVD